VRTLHLKASPVRMVLTGVHATSPLRTGRKWTEAQVEGTHARQPASRPRMTPVILPPLLRADSGRPARATTARTVPPALAALESPRTLHPRNLRPIGLWTRGVEWVFDSHHVSQGRVGRALALWGSRSLRALLESAPLPGPRAPAPLGVRTADGQKIAAFGSPAV
jgi:hypothetical protein